MSEDDASRVRIIRALKFGLPAVAVAIFASLFIFSSARYSDQISFDGVDLSALEEGLKLINPRFTGATNRGEPFSVSAEWALPDGPRPERVELNSVSGEINLADGRIVSLSATSGVLEPKANILTLTDGVRFASSDGYEITALTARFDGDRDELTATGEVIAEGALGRIRADRMRATRRAPEQADENVDASARDNGDKGAYIWFENRVKVRIEQPNMASE